jgi:hypothetical protein
MNVPWRDDVLGLLPELPPTFTTRDLYRLVPRLRSLHPENHHIEEKLRQVLQQFRDERVIAFSPEGGTYTKLGTYATDNRIWPWAKGAEITREDISLLFGQGGVAGLNRGMFRPGEGHPWRHHMVLFHDEVDNPYNDTVEQGKIIYTGEGRQELGDQKLVRNNRHLANHLEEGTHVHFFVQPKRKPGKIRYEGEVLLQGMQYTRRPEENRSVYQFILSEISAEDAIAQVGAEILDIQEQRRAPGLEDRTVVLTMQRRLARDPAFRAMVLTAYERECSVCGKPLRKEPAIDLQAAHIIGVRERGRDEVRNGLALCARHHWAFDNGFFSLQNNFRVVWLGVEDDPHGEVRHGESIHVPKLEEDRPHSSYLAFHRSKWRVPT